MHNISTFLVSEIPSARDEHFCRYDRLISGHVNHTHETKTVSFLIFRSDCAHFFSNQGCHGTTFNTYFGLGADRLRFNLVIFAFGNS